jgi:hypothetical protein
MIRNAADAVTLAKDAHAALGALDELGFGPYDAEVRYGTHIVILTIPAGSWDDPEPMPCMTVRCDCGAPCEARSAVLDIMRGAYWYGGYRALP